MPNFPTSLDNSTSIPNPTGTNTQNNPDHAALHSTTGDAVKAVEAKLGIGASTPVANTFLFGTGTGTSAWTVATSAQVAAAVSDETGSGSLVFATTPTLVTPKVDTINESTPANGVTIDGLNIKDSAINTAGAVGTAALATGIQVAQKSSNPYKFSAYASATQALTANTPLKVQFNTELFDTGSNYDSVTNFRFTAPIAGFYFVNTQVNIGSAGIAAGQSALIYLYKNGSEFRRSDLLDGSGSASRIITPKIVDFVQLAANDYLEVYAQTSDTARFTGNGSNITFFNGLLVSQT